MIDPSVEKLIPLGVIPDLVPGRVPGQKIHVSTVHRWAFRGVRGIRLEILQVGGMACTTSEALARFFAALTSARMGELLPDSQGTSAASSAPRSVAQRRRASESATAELERIGA